MAEKSIFKKLIALNVIVAFFNIIPVFADIPDAVLVNQQTDLTVKNNKLYKSYNFELRINNRSGDQYAEISIPYSKMSKVSKIEACIKDKDGIIIKKLKSGDITERSTMQDFSFYEDNFVKEFTLKHNEYPYTICYSYMLQEEAFFYIDLWSPSINTEVPTLNSLLTLEVPRDYKITFDSQLIDSFKVDTAETSIKYRWRASYINLYDSEIYSPNERSFVPEVYIVPDKFKYDQIGSFYSWKTYGNWESRLLDGLSILPDEEKQHINSLINGVEHDKEKIKILYHYLQDVTRYINISVETGGMKPAPAAFVSVNKYGDCKGLTNYFKSILNYAGIPSIYTDVEAGDPILPLKLQFPSQQFNHVFLCVPLKNDTVWLDCTSHGPFNYLGTFTQNRQVFLVDKDNSHFTRTPHFSKDDVLDTRKIFVNPDSKNDNVACFHNIFRGYSFEYLTELNKTVNDSKKTQFINDHFIATGFEPIDYKIIPAHRDSSFITFDYTAKSDKLFKKYGNELLIQLIPFSLPAFKDSKNRKYPLQIDYPIHKMDSIDYQLPFGYQLSNLPKNQTINSKYGDYDLRFLQKDTKIEVIKSFVLNAGNWPLDQYKDFFKFVRSVYDIENYTYIVTKKQD
jgi:hypothetical protein